MQKTNTVDGKILNLGCGLKASDHPAVVNIDWSVYLRLSKLTFIRPFLRLVVGCTRRDRLNAIPKNIVVHDLSKGLPFRSESVYAVYHSHFLEHLDRDVAELFVREVLRVLRPGGIHRIVVPDFEGLCRRCLAHLDSCEGNQLLMQEHDGFIADIIEQCVRKEAAASKKQGLIRSRLERFLLGDARRRGETHQWMYDRVNLTVLLQSVGFKTTVISNCFTSQIPDWNEIGLDLDKEGNQYKPDSLYIEAIK